MSQPIVVDDQDSSIRYGGADWTLKNNARWFNGDSNFPRAPGAYFNFTFTGTSVQVVGDVDAHAGGGDVVKLDFILDGGNPTPYTGASQPIYRATLFTQSDLSASEHTLSMTINSRGYLWLDYLLYTPVPGKTTVEDNTILFIDDGDPVVVYGGQWTKSVSTTDALAQTASRATQAGSTASLKFTGSSVNVYGSLDKAEPDQMPKASFYIDGNRMNTLQYVPPSSGSTFNNLLFSATGLDKSTSHELLVKTENDASFWLDYVLVSPQGTIKIASNNPESVASIPSSASSNSISGVGSQTSNSISAGSSQTSSTSGAPSFTSSVPSPTWSDSGDSSSTSPTSSNSGDSSSTSPTSSNSSASSSTSHTIGGAVGGVVGAIALVALLFVMLRRRRKRESLTEAERDISQARPYSPLSPSASEMRYATLASSTPFEDRKRRLDSPIETNSTPASSPAVDTPTPSNQEQRFTIHSAPPGYDEVTANGNQPFSSGHNS